MFFILPMSFKDLFPGLESFINLLPSEWFLQGLRQLNATEATMSDHLLKFGLLLAVGLAGTAWSVFSLRRYDGSIE